MCHFLFNHKALIILRRMYLTRNRKDLMNSSNAKSTICNEIMGHSIPSPCSLGLYSQSAWSFSCMLSKSLCFLEYGGNQHFLYILCTLNMYKYSTYIGKPFGIHYKYANLKTKIIWGCHASLRGWWCDNQYKQHMHLLPYLIWLSLRNWLQDLQPISKNLFLIFLLLTYHSWTLSPKSNITDQIFWS